MHGHELTRHPTGGIAVLVAHGPLTVTVHDHLPAPTAAKGLAVTVSVPLWRIGRVADN
jgi:hypothetical protein